MRVPTSGEVRRRMGHLLALAGAVRFGSFVGLRWPAQRRATHDDDQEGA